MCVKHKYTIRKNMCSCFSYMYVFKYLCVMLLILETNINFSLFIIFTLLMYRLNNQKLQLLTKSISQVSDTQICGTTKEMFWDFGIQWEFQKIHRLAPRWPCCWQFILWEISSCIVKCVDKLACVFICVCFYEE